MFGKRRLSNIEIDFAAIQSRFLGSGGTVSMAKELVRLMDDAQKHLPDPEASALAARIDKFRWDNNLVVSLMK